MTSHGIMNIVCFVVYVCIGVLIGIGLNNPYLGVATSLYLIFMRQTQ
jgi:hypothetical protein